MSDGQRGHRELSAMRGRTGKGRHSEMRTSSAQWSLERSPSMTNAPSQSGRATAATAILATVSYRIRMD